MPARINLAGSLLFGWAVATVQPDHCSRPRLPDFRRQVRCSAAAMTPQGMRLQSVRPRLRSWSPPWPGPAAAMARQPACHGPRRPRLALHFDRLQTPERAVSPALNRSKCVPFAPQLGKTLLARPPKKGTRPLHYARDFGCFFLCPFDVQGAFCWHFQRFAVALVLFSAISLGTCVNH